MTQVEQLVALSRQVLFGSVLRALDDVQRNIVEMDARSAEHEAL